MAALPLDPVVWTPENVQDHFYARCVAIAGLTLMIWTHLTTLDEEKKYIWNYGVGLTLNKALFCVVRYFATVTILLHCISLFLAQPSLEVVVFTLLQVCRGMLYFVCAGGLSSMAAGDIILLLRTWAIYQRTRRALICLVILFWVTHLPSIVVGAIWITNLHIGPSQLYPVISGCFLESTDMIGFLHVIGPSVVLTTILSGALMYKIWSYHRASIKAPLISLLARDGALYYAIVLTVYLCIAFFLFHKRLITVTIEGRFIWIIAVTCAQLQLNLRIAVYHIPGYTATYSQPPTGSRVLSRRPNVDPLATSELENRHDSPSTEHFTQA